MTMTQALSINAAINILVMLNLAVWFILWGLGVNGHIAGIGFLTGSIVGFSNMYYRHWINKHYVQTKNPNPR